MPIESIKGGLRLERTFKNLPDVLRFEATSIHMERDKPYAVLTLILNTRVLAYDDMCLSKNEERTRLVNSAYRMLESNTVLTDQYSKEFFKHELDIFCRDIWPEWVGSKAGGLMAGDSTMSLMPYVVDPYVVQGGGTLLYGPPGAGKSWLLMLIAVCVDAGLQWPWKTMQTTVLFDNIERSASSVSRRLGVVNRALGLPPERPLLTLNARGKSLRETAEAVERTIAEHDVGFLALDSISRAGVGDLTTDRAANTVTDLLNDLCPTWLALAHAPRPPRESGTTLASHVFGSVHFDAGADVVVKLLSEQRGTALGVSLAVDKVNDGMRGFKQMIALDFDPKTGLSGIRMAKDGEFVELGLSEAMTLTERIIITIQSDGPQSATQLASALGHDRTYITKVLLGSELFMGVREGREVLYHLRPKLVSPPVGKSNTLYQEEPQHDEQHDPPELPF